MDAVEFLKTKIKMCRYFVNKGKNNRGPLCIYCPLSSNNNDNGDDCNSYICEFPEKSVEIIEKWKEEHQCKTRLSEFLRMFPNAYLDDGLPKFCIEVYDQNENCVYDDCFECRNKYWNTEVTENENA